VILAEKSMPAKLKRNDKRIFVSLSKPIDIATGEKMEILVS
jgi:hypothetical protein